MMSGDTYDGGLRAALVEAVDAALVTYGGIYPAPAEDVADAVLEVLVASPEPYPLTIPDGGQLCKAKQVVSASQVARDPMVIARVRRNILRRIVTDCTDAGLVFRTDRVLWHEREITFGPPIGEPRDVRPGEDPDAYEITARIWAEPAR